MAVRVLIARPDHLGDVLLTLPAATAFRAAFPGTHLAFMLSPSTADVARRCPDIDETLVLPFPPLGATHAVTDWDEVARANAKALQNRFDLMLAAERRRESVEAATNTACAVDSIAHLAPLCCRRSLRPRSRRTACRT